MNWLIPMPIVLPLLASALCMLVGRSRTAQRAVSLTALSLASAASVALVVASLYVVD